MKTRIISGIVMGIIVALVLTLGFLWNPIVISIAVALLAAGAVYELTHTVAKIKSKPALVGACVYAFFGTFIMLEIAVNAPMYLSLSSYWGRFENLKFGLLYLFILTVAYFIFSAILVLKNLKDMTLATIVTLCALPLFVIGAFSSLGNVINNQNGIYYLLLLFNFSCVCDMGAYFVGVTLGKHKLCPNISPKKTVEGAIGGIVSSIIVTVILTLCFNKSMLLPMILTIPLCVLGMIGDLFASSIKRTVDLKDYGNLIPGHGGILDRLDSILMISPLLYILVQIGVI